jgi:hypothetical protein
MVVKELGATRKTFNLRNATFLPIYHDLRRRRPPKGYLPWKDIGFGSNKNRNNQVLLHCLFLLYQTIAALPRTQKMIMVC